jgi:hypothetical protein
MNPDSKFLLEEIRKEFADQKKLIDKRFSDHDVKWEQRLKEVEVHKEERIDALETVATAFEVWKPSIEATMETAKTEVQKLSKHWERTVKDKSSADPGIFSLLTNVSSPGSVLPPPSAGGQADGPNGHHSDLWNRGPGYGSVTYTQIPDKGTPNFPPLRSPFPKPHEYVDTRGGNSTGKLPKLNFPTFTGDNPRLWLSRCENYFDMYNVEEFRWI